MLTQGPKLMKATLCVEYDLWDFLVFLHTNESPLSGGLAYPEIEQRPSTSHAWS